MPFHPPGDSWQALLIQRTYELVNFCYDTIRQAYDIYNSQIETEKESVGRAINPTIPFQISGGIYDSIELIESVESTLENYHAQIRECVTNTQFGLNDSHERVAKTGINVYEDIIRRTRLFAHTYLWIHWANEGLRQANQFGAQLQSENNLKRFSEKVFPYLAHPALIVSTIACTTMIEEVGAEYINGFVSGNSYNHDETSASSILRDLKQEYPSSSEFDLNKISEHVIAPRDDLSHYVRKRKDVITMDEFKDFYLGVIESIEFVDDILLEILEPPIREFQREVNSLYVAE